MTKLIGTTAVTLLTLGTALPAFAAAHVDVTSLTCGEYNAMSEVDQDKVAMMVVEELNSAGGGSLEANTGTLRAASGDETVPADIPQEGNLVANDGTLRAASGDEPEPDAKLLEGYSGTAPAETIALMDRTCMGSPTARVIQAAVGNDGTG